MINGFRMSECFLYFRLICFYISVWYLYNYKNLFNINKKRKEMLIIW